MTSPLGRDYTLALQLAAEHVGAQHPQEIARRSGAFAEEIRGRIYLTLEMLGRRYVIPHPQVDVRFADSPEEVPLWIKVLVLHYLERGSAERLTGEMVTFQEVESGTFFLPFFRERVLGPLVGHFGCRPEAMVDAAKSAYNGEERERGDVSVTVFAFPYVPVTLVLWRGDEEFQPEGSILFDSTVSKYLPAEDLTTVCQMLVQGLIEADQQRT